MMSSLRLKCRGYFIYLFKNKMHKLWSLDSCADYFLFWCLFVLKFIPGTDIVPMNLSLFSTTTTKCMMSTVRVRVLLAKDFMLTFASACSDFDFASFLVTCSLQMLRLVIQILCCTLAAPTVLS